MVSALPPQAVLVEKTKQKRQCSQNGKLRLHPVGSRSSTPEHRSKPPKKGEALFIEKLFRSQSTPHFAMPFFYSFPFYNLALSNHRSKLQCIIYPVGVRI